MLGDDARKMITTANIGLHGIQQNLISNGTEELFRRLSDKLVKFAADCFSITNSDAVLAQPVKKEKGLNFIFVGIESEVCV